MKRPILRNPRPMHAGAFVLMVFLILARLVHGQNPEAKALDNEIEQHFEKKEFAQAIPLLDRLLSIREQTYGADDARTNDTVGALGFFYDKIGERTRAIGCRERDVAWRQKHRPDESQTARTINNLALAYAEAGMFSKSETMYLAALKIYARLKGSEADQVTTKQNLAIMFAQANRHADAVPVWKEVVAILEAARGAKDEQTTAARLSLLRELGRAGDVQEAERLAAALKKDGITDPTENALPPALNALRAESDRLFAQGQFAQIPPVLEKLLAGEEREFGPHDLRLFVPLSNLALISMKLGDYTKAETLGEKALALARENRGPKSMEAAQVLDNLAQSYALSGVTAKAESLYRECLAIREAGGDRQALADTLNNLGLLYEGTGELDKAEPLFERALDLYRQTLGEESPRVATVLTNLGMVHYAEHDLEKAAALLRRAVEICEKTIGPAHPDIADTLNDLALTYTDLGRLREAVPLYERSYKIHETALGAEHPLTITSMTNLGTLWMNLGEYEKAEPLLRRAAEEEERIFPGSAKAAVNLNNLANFHAVTGHMAEAIACWRKAAEAHTRAAGLAHPYTERILTNLGAALIENGQNEEALNFALKARDSGFQVLSKILAFAPEQERLAYHASENPYGLLAALGRDRDLGLTVLRHKGVVLDSILEDRVLSGATGQSDQKDQLDRLYSLKAQMSQLARQGETGAKTEKLQEEAGRIEGELARRFLKTASAREAANVTVEEVQEQIPADAMLIEYVRFLSLKTLVDHYAAVLFGHAGDCRWIDLGAADEIDGHVALYRKSARGNTDQSTLTAALHTLYADLWSPLAGHLGQSRVVISPDGNLNFVSFATLLTNEDRFLIEKHSISYVSTGRDLLRAPKSSSSGPAIFFGNPDFAGETKTPDHHFLAGTTRSPVGFDRRSMDRLELAPLPGTALECSALEAQARELGLPTQLFSGADATKWQLRSVAGARVLHFATHGFFLPENANRRRSSHPPGGGISMMLPERTPGADALIEDPMNRSGLALAGAQRTLDAWAKGEVPPAENDGIVTADEVGSLKLQGTWLVALSACDTGTGEARAGEGVMGLRRGFIQAGAQNLLLTLWAISDATTVEIMKEFYARALKSGNAPQALADTQREWLVKLRQEKGLLAAVTLAGPFIMSSQGKP